MRLAAGLQRIRGFLNDMRYINPRFTYLLTYSDRTGWGSFSAPPDLLAAIGAAVLVLRGGRGRGKGIASSSGLGKSRWLR